MRPQVLGLVLVAAAQQAAAEPVLSLPIDCVPGDSCHIQQYVDRAPGPEATDFRCGGLSYDGHKGTDFALPTLREMNEGVNVLAAAPGIVRGLRDGVPDRYFDPANETAVENRECGNGVVLVHEDGWETQYCHMKRGSVQVRQGDRVERGQVLGQVGLSGKTQFPHLHLSVRHEGRVVDPYNLSPPETCGTEGGQLWQETPTYQAGGMLSAGFADQVPDYGEVRAGTAGQSELSDTAPGLVLFGYAFGGQAGDVLRLTIEGPEGQVIDHRDELDRNRALFFRAAGRRLTADRWPQGTYTGLVTLLRNGAEISRMSTTATIP